MKAFRVFSDEPCLQPCPLQGNCVPRVPFNGYGGMNSISRRQECAPDVRQAQYAVPKDKNRFRRESSPAIALGMAAYKRP